MQVNDSYRGTLSSYCYVLMCIHLLQQRQPAILPCLQSLKPATYQRYPASQIQPCHPCCCLLLLFCPDARALYRLVRRLHSVNALLDT